MSHVILYVGLTLFISFILKYYLSDRFKIPAVTIYILLGVLLGVSFFKIYNTETLEHLDFISKIALGLIAFIIGSELNKDVIFSLGKSIIFIAVFEALAAFFVVLIAIKTFTDLPSYYALILGAVASATAPAATVAVIQQYKAKGPLTSTIMGVVGIDDAVALIIFVFASIFASNMLKGVELSLVTIIVTPLKNIFISVAIGIVSGIMFSIIMKRIRDTEILLMAIMAFILIQLGITELLDVSELLAIMFFGSYLANVNKLLTHQIKNIVEYLTPIILPLFFIFAGAHLNIGLIGKIGLLGVIYTIARITGKVSGSYMGAVLGKAQPVVRRWIGFSLIPQVGVAIALALAVSHKFGTDEYGQAGKELTEVVINILLFTTIITEILGPLLTKISLGKAKEIPFNFDNVKQGD
jgi:Kef-type K+ transport system membrane component KefB